MTTPTQRVLLVEDNRAAAMLIHDLLRYETSGQFELTWADSLQQAFTHLRKEEFEAIMLDFTLPDSQGLTALEKIQTAAPDIPIIVMTGLEDERLAIRAIRQGAQDYLVKGNLDGRAISRSIQYSIARKGVEEGAHRQASAAKDQWLAVLSHDLRIPLKSALAAAAALLEQPGLADPVREGLEMIQQNITLEVQLIGDLLDVTSIARGKIQLKRRPLDVASILRGAADICQPDLAGKCQSLAIDTPDAPYPVLGDSRWLHQVFWTLIKSAAKFTPHGGRIGLTCSVRGGKPQTLLVEVRATGTGIEPEDLNRFLALFEQEETQPLEGAFGELGLRVTLCRRVIELHDGRILAFSAGSGKGATFTVEVPLVDSPPT